MIHADGKKTTILQRSVMKERIHLNLSLCLTSVSTFHWQLISGNRSVFISSDICNAYLGFPGGSTIKNLPARQETLVQSLGWEDPPEKRMATHSNILAWRIPWTEEPDGLQFMGSQKSWIQLSD